MTGSPVLKAAPNRVSRLVNSSSWARCCSYRAWVSVFQENRFKDLARIMFAEGLLLSAGDSGKQANGGIISFIAVRRSPDGALTADHCLQSSSYIIRYFGCGLWLSQVAVDSSKDKVGVLYIMYIMYIKPG